jgi:UDPglucose--hexose-1-phosphate uridylyltransferase
LPEWDESCPFCPGNEAQTPNELLRLPALETLPWQVRVVPNRFPALSLDGDIMMKEEGRLLRKRPGVGVHEVIIETPSHNIPMALMTYEQVESVLIAYQERYKALREDRRLKFITIFKNHGWASGTSLVHSHSQLVATPVAATYYRQKLDVAMDYYDDVGRCLYCDLITEELERAERIVAETEEFVLLHPYASRVPWESWIIPKGHWASFGQFPTALLHHLAMILRDTLFCLYKCLDNPAFNYTIETSTTELEEDPSYHWHLRILPRLTTIAGFEIGSGMYINIQMPEDTAELMRKKACSFPGDQCPTLKRATS